jgi:hypothetical protein
MTTREARDTRERRSKYPATFNPLQWLGGAEQITLDACIQPEFGPLAPDCASITEYHVTLPAVSVLASSMISFVPAGGVFLTCEVVEGS